MPEEKKGALGKVLGGSLFLKIIVLIGVVLIVLAVLAVLNQKTFDLGKIVVQALQLGLGLIIIVLVVRGLTGIFFKASIPQPNQTWRASLIKGAIRRKPAHTAKKLMIRGEDMLVYSCWFKRVLGIMFLPYLAAKQKLDVGTGLPQYKKKTDERGKIVFDKEKRPVMVKDYEDLNEKSGEWVIVGSSTPAWQFWKREIEVVRADRELVSPIGDTIWIKCVNLVPYNDYFYPNQQWQDDIARIVTQNKEEVLNESLKELLNLPAQVAQMTLRSDPTYLKWKEMETQQLANQSAPVLLRG